MRYLKQPLIIGYIITGFLTGPYFLNILTSVEVVELFSKLGITALLFIVGLGLSPKVLKELGYVSSIVGIGQVTFTTIIGFLISRFLGYSNVESIYVAIALTFSSTIIILKLLSDKGDISKLYGRLAIGFLLIQDLVATIILVTISSLGAVGGSGTSILLNLSILLLQGFILLLVLFYFSLNILSRMNSFLAKSQEFLFIASLAWGMSIASLYAYLGLSIEIGALVAGVTLSMTPYANEVSSRLKPFRDFFIILFFILLGNQLVLENWQSLVAPTTIFSAYVLIGNPIIILVLLNLLGYTKKTGFLAGLTVAQISEFSLILVKLGQSSGHLTNEVVSLVTLVGIITIAGSSYLIIYSEYIYKKVAKYLSIFEFRKIETTKRLFAKKYEALIFGYRRAGPEFAHTLDKSKTKYLVIDYNPDTIEKLEEKKIPCEYGDASDPEFMQELPLKNIKAAISTIPEFETNHLITTMIRRYNPNAVVIIIADTMDHALSLYEAGASIVVLSHYVGAHYAAEMLYKNGFEIEKYNKVRESQIKYLDDIRHFRF